MTNKILFFAMLCVMLAIFIFSSQDDENTYELSGNVTERVNEAASGLTSGIKVKSADNAEISFYDKYLKKYLAEFYIRKAAHVFLYILLAAAAAGFFYTSSFIKKPIFSIPAAFAAAFLYSLTDEFHQSFINGRQDSFKDILIDSSGAVIGIIIFVISAEIIKKLRSF